MLNLNDAGSAAVFDLIPAGTIATVQMIIRPGGAGEDGWLKRSADGGSEGLDCRIHRRRHRICQAQNLAVPDPERHHRRPRRSCGDLAQLLRGIVESAFDIKPDDASEAAQQKRNRMDVADFNNLRFIARISIEKSKDPAYRRQEQARGGHSRHEGLEGRRAAPGVDTDGLAGRGGGGSTGPGRGSWQARAGHCKAGLGAQRQG